jgi:hypothetical protein
MATSRHRVYSDLFNLSDFVKQVAVSQGKNLIIDALREYFRQDTLYKFSTDAFGFPLTPDLTEMDPSIQNERTTRIFIGDSFRLDKRFYPSVVVKYSSGRYKPISFNQNYTINHRVDLVTDGYGNNSFIKTPISTVVTGAWEQSFEIQIATESVPDREEITDIIASFFIGKVRQEIYEAGLFIKSVSISSEREEKWANDNVYIQTITLETYSEWRREIPIDDLLETISFCFKYGVFDSGEISTDVTTVDVND